ncbi:hypothetical protein KSS87_005809, partial [Heliosperma pusillum]
MGPNVVIEASNGDKCPVYLSVLEKFKSQFGNDSIDVKDILAKLPTQKEGGDDFKCNFIIYIFSALLGGVVGNQASLKLLKSLANTDSISDFNWCNFIKRKLANQVQSWQKEEFEAKQLKENWFGGPTMALVFVYLDRCVFKSRLVSRQFPTLSTWTTEAISKRINDELNDKNSKTRTFGRGSVEPPLVMSQHMPHAPSSLLKIEFRQTSKSLGAPSSEHQQPEQQESEHAETAAPAVSSNLGSASEFVDKFAESAKVLAQSFLQYKSLASQAPIKQDRLINLLQSKLPSVTDLTSMAMPEVFVPKSILKCNQIDNGLYLLNILENYKGNKTNSLITVNTEAQLRRFALRVCHQIATCSGNLSKEIVEKDALELSSSLGLPFTDKELVNCVGRRTKAIAYEVLVSTPWMDVTRDALQALTSRGLVMDQAVDAETNPEIWGQYIKPQYTPADGSHIDMVFIPFHSKKWKHWWACICDLKQGKNFILDSMQSINVDEDNNHASEILFNVSTILGE